MLSRLRSPLLILLGVLIGLTTPALAAYWGNHLLAFLDVADQTLSGGANLTPFSMGTASSGTKTPDCGKNPAQTLTNGGAFTLAAPSSDGMCVVKITNNGSAGTITPSGFSPSACAGASFDTTNGHKFDVWIGRIGGDSTCSVLALQ